MLHCRASHARRTRASRPAIASVSLALTLVLIFFWAIPSRAGAVAYTAFGFAGEGGTAHGQVFTLGGDASVFMLDAFVHFDGLDLNGPREGSSAQLSCDSLPPSVGYTFAAEASEDATDIRLVYTLTNLSTEQLSPARFYVLFDAEIQEELNTFFNERGVVVGCCGAGAADPDPDFWSIGESGYASGDMVVALQQGALDSANTLAAPGADDVAMALGFDIGQIRPGSVARIEVLISEDGESIGSLTLTQLDAAANSDTYIAFSGHASVSEDAYFLEIGHEVGGSAAGTGGWHAAGEFVSIGATPSTCQRFSGWSGDVPSEQAMDNPLHLAMDRDRSIVATFMPNDVPPDLLAPVDLSLEFPADTSPTWTGWAASEDAGDWPSFGGSTYQVVELTTNATWADAQVEALGAGGHLATIESVEENEFLMGLIGDVAWVGARTIGTDMIWQWVNGSPLEGAYSNWDPVEAPLAPSSNELALAVSPLGATNELGEDISGMWSPLFAVATNVRRCVIERDCRIDLWYEDELTTNADTSVSIARRWFAADECGLTNTCVQTITVVDTTAPVLVLPPDVASLPVDANGEAVYSGPGATATDNSDPNVVVTSIPGVPATFMTLGTHAVVWSATDASGNSASATQSVTVVDTTAPVVEIQGVRQGGVYTGTVVVTVTVIDALDVNVSKMVTLDGASYVSGTEIATEGGHSLVVLASDSAGNSTNVTVGFEIVSSGSDTEMVVDDAGCQYGDNVVFRAVLTAEGQAAVGAEVQFALDGEPIGGAQTDSSGAARSTNAVFLAAGMYTIDALFDGDASAGIAPSASSSLLTVTPETAQISYEGDRIRTISEDVWLAAIACEEDDGAPGDLVMLDVRFDIALLCADGTSTNVASFATPCDEQGFAELWAALGSGVYAVSASIASNGFYGGKGDTAVVAVYDPTEGKASGGGWIDVQVPEEGDLGRANFGFIAKYKLDVASGHLEFQYKDGGMDLKSHQIDWLVISSVSAQFQGRGIIKGWPGTYTFRVSCKDDEKDDRFTIKVWEGDDTEADPLYKALNQELQGGNIVVH